MEIIVQSILIKDSQSHLSQPLLCIRPFSCSNLSIQHHNFPIVSNPEICQTLQSSSITLPYFILLGNPRSCCVCCPGAIRLFDLSTSTQSPATLRDLLI